MKKKLLFLPLICSILSVVLWVIAEVHWLIEEGRIQDSDRIISDVYNLMFGVTITIALSIVLILLRKIDVSFLWMGLCLFSLCYLVIVLKGVISPFDYNGNFEMYNPCYELIGNIKTHTIMPSVKIDTMIIIQSILRIVSIAGVFILSLIMYYSDEVVHVIEIPFKIMLVVMVFCCVISAVVTAEPTKSSNKDTKICSSCGREFERGTSNSKSIRKTNMCSNCYENYKYLDNLGY